MRSPLRTTVWAAALVALATPSRARGLDGVSLSAQPGYTHVDAENTASTGKSSSTSDGLVQVYTLGINRELLPALKLDILGNVDDAMYWSDDRPKTEAFAATGAASLSFGSPLLSGSGSYAHREEIQRTVGVPSLRLVNDVASLSAAWRPLDLPELSLRLSRGNTHDEDRHIQDSTTTTAILAARYARDPRLTVEGGATFDQADDHRTDTQTRSFSESARVGYGERILDGRTNVGANYQIGFRTSTTTSHGVGGTVATQKFPVAGLSLIEDLPASPISDTLLPNASLIDANVATPTTVDVGFARTVAGDTRYRDLGAQFPDVITRVNAIYVWVSQPLPSDVAMAFTWEAYRSDDNLTWTPVAITGPAVFAAFQNRFEISIEPTTARYLKLVTRPLLPAVTLDPKFAAIFVTELQFFEIVPASSVEGTANQLVNQVTGSARTQLLRDPALAYDLSGAVSRTDSWGVGASTSTTTWNVTNGLALDKRLTRVVVMAARVARQDSDAGSGHEGALLYSASLAARPLPTFTSTLSYTGSVRDPKHGIWLVTNAVSSFSQAQLYRGIGVTANGGYSASLAGSATTTAAFVNTTATVTPHPSLRFGGAWQFSRNTSSSPGRDTVSRTQSVSGSASFSPTPATFLVAGIQRIIEGPRPTTLANGSVGISPFQGGDLQLRFSYSRSLDTAAETLSDMASAAARWNIRDGLYVEASYDFLKTDAPGSENRIRQIVANLYWRVL